MISRAEGIPSRGVRYLSQNRPGVRMGMGHYERLLLRHLLPRAGTRWQFDITFDGRPPRPPLVAADVAPGIHKATTLGFSTRRLGRLPWGLARTLVGAFAGHRPTLYHSLALSFPAPGNAPAIYTIHDLPPARFADEGEVPAWAKQAVAAAQFIQVPSQFAANELHELLGVPEHKLRVIPNGCENEVFHPGVPPASADQLGQLGINGPFLVYVGGSTRRKNVAAMLRAWRALAAHHTEMTLLLVGPAESLQQLVLESRAPRAIVAGYLGRDLLPNVMRASEALVFPSIYEGFGLPPLEAMAMGVPVVAVRGGAVREVVADAGLLAPDGSAEALEQAIETLLEDSDLRAKLREAGPLQAAVFSWDRHAFDILQLYEQLAA